ncbi:hypothetical protein C0J52_15868 [Blattella germanica]|nr:hypothetical protein C0J52_15868 [Blattella germanica]
MFQLTPQNVRRAPLQHARDRSGAVERVHVVRGHELQFLRQRVSVGLWNAQLPHVLLQLSAQAQCRRRGRGWAWLAPRTARGTGTSGALLGAANGSEASASRGRSRQLRLCAWPHAARLQRLDPSTMAGLPPQLKVFKIEK